MMSPRSGRIQQNPAGFCVCGEHREPLQQNPGGFCVMSPRSAGTEQNHGRDFPESSERRRTAAANYREVPA
jgi:hypothetical protein